MEASQHSDPSVQADDSSIGSTSPSGAKREVIDALPVTVEAILGVAKIRIGELRTLVPGDVFSLDARLGDPVALRLNGEVIAYGELVSMEDKFAVRIQAVAED